MTKTNFSSFQRLFGIVLKYPRMILCGFIALFLFCGWGLKFSRLELDIYDVYDPNFQSSIDLMDMKEYYSDRSQMLVSFSFPSKPSSEELCRLQTWSRNLLTYKEVKSVTSIWSVRQPLNSGDKLWYPRVLENPCETKGELYETGPEIEQSFFRHLIAHKGSSELAFDISFSGSESDVQQVQFVINETEQFLKADLPRVKVRYLGLAGFRYYFKKIMLGDSIYNLIILLIIFLLMRAIYGTWKSGFYLGLTLVASNVVLYGIMGHLGLPIDILTNNLFLMTAVAGAADFIFTTQFQMTGKYEESFRRLIVPCFFTTLTTVIGFLSLNTSDLSIIKRFGNGAAIGALAEWAMMFLFLPAVLKTFRIDQNWVNPSKAFKLKILDRLEALPLPHYLLKILTVLMLLSIPAFFFLNDQDSPVENLPKTHVLRKGYEEFGKNFSWQGQVYLYFDEVPSASDHQSILKKIARLPLVHRVEDPQDLVASWTQGVPELRGALIQRELSMTPLWKRYYSGVGNLRVPLYLKEQDLHSLRKLRKEILSICGNKCRLAGQRVVYLEYGEKISKTMIESFAVSILLVVGILAWLLWIEGKIKYLLPVVLSSLMGPLVILTLIALFQIPVTLITSIFLAVMVGLAGDNAIQYLLADEADLVKGIDSRSRASVIVTLVMVFGSSMFILQSLLPMKILGGLFIMGFLINLLGDLWGLKALLLESE